MSTEEARTLLDIITAYAEEGQRVSLAKAFGDDTDRRDELAEQFAAAFNEQSAS